MEPISAKQEQFINDNLGFFTDKLIEMACIPAPSNHEEKRAAWVKALLESFGCEGVYQDEALNVVYPYNCEGASEIYVLSAHTDVVFPDTEALPLRREGDIIHCPGIGDDTANAMAVITMAKYFAENKPETKRGIIFSLVSGEEGLGNLKGVRKLMETWGDRVKGFVTLDTGYGGMVVGAVGSTRYEITVTEQGGHSFGNFGRPNAIAELAQIITELYQVRVPVKEGTKTTFNVGGISGGTSVNTIAPNATCLYEYRSDDLGCMAYMKSCFDAVIAKAKALYSKVDVKVVGERPCGNVCGEEQEKWVKMLYDAQMVYADREIVPRHSSTDCNIPLSMGIPSGSVGTYVCSGAHTRQEWLDLTSVPRALKIVLCLVNSWLT